jgi:hypothetical protein
MIEYEGGQDWGQRPGAVSTAGRRGKPGLRWSRAERAELEQS